MHTQRSRRRRNIFAVALATALATAGIVWAAQPSVAATCTTLGGFEIDGDFTDGTAGCVPTGDDWDTPGLGVQSTTNIGTYSASSKDDDDPAGWTSAGGTPDKSDFSVVHAFTRIVGGHFFAYVGWDRDSGTGTGAYAIEIDNLPIRLAGDGVTPQPDRSNGGFVIFLDFQGAALPTFNKACAFTSVADYPGTCVVTPGAGYAAQINDATQHDPLANLDVPAGQFFEAAIDFTELTGITPSCPAPSAASLYLRSITGNTLKNLKGYVEPLEVAPPSTCVPPAMATTATPGGDLNPPGTAQHDLVTVGNGNPAGIGTVAFFLCSPAEVTANGGDCSANGTQVGGSVLLDVGGQGSSANASGATTTPLGKYCWRAEFTPGADEHTYSAATHTNSTTECFTIVHASPTLATQITVGGNEPGTLGLTTLSDTATLSGFAGSVTGELITFNLYGPYDALETPDCLQADLTFTTTGALSAGGVATPANTFDPTVAGVYVWVASYAGNALNDPATHPCNQALEKATLSGAIITVDKSAVPPGPVSAGDTIGFDINVQNGPDATALNVQIDDDLPLGAGLDLNWSLSPAFPGCLISGANPQHLHCDLGSIAKNGSAGPIHVESATSDEDCGLVSNTAFMTVGNGAGGQDSASVTINCPDPDVSKTADNDVVNSGEEIGFTITASNSDAPGTGTLHGAAISDPLPQGDGVFWLIDPAYAGPGTCQIDVDPNPPFGQTLNCALGDLAPGATATVHIISGTAFVSCGVYDNTATLSATNALNDTSSDSTRVNCPDVSLAKDADQDVVSAGTSIGFTITASNSGAPNTGTAVGAEINDDLPPGNGVEWVIESQTSDNCSILGAPPTQTLFCSSFDLAPGESLTVHIVSGTAFVSCGVYDNTASLTIDNGPFGPPVGDQVPQPIPVEASDSVTVDCPALVLSKTPDAANQQLGDTIGFTITVTNNGPGVATAVVIHDPLPPAPGVSWSISPAYAGPGICNVTGPDDDQVLDCELGDLQPTDAATVHIESATTAVSCGLYKNTATAQGSNHPPVTADAQTNVVCVEPTEPTHMPETGAEVTGQLGWAGGLLLGGLLFLLLGATRRKPNRGH